MLAAPVWLDNNEQPDLWNLRETRLLTREFVAMLVNLPELSVIAGLAVAEIHGRIGDFPALLRLRAMEGVVVQQYEAGDILNLQQVRDSAQKQW